MANPKPGDLVEFIRKLGYSHWGVADGQGNVFHATSDTSSSGSMIKKQPITEVASGDTFRVNNKDEKFKPLDPQTIIANAQMNLGMRFNYAPLSNNCETWATGMRYGKGFTDQGDHVKEEAEKFGKDFLKHSVETHNPFGGK